MSTSQDKGLDWINSLASWLIGCAVILMTFQVILRFVFKQPQPWAEEINRYCFVWATYLGSVIALVKGSHIRVTVVTDQLGSRWKRMSDILDRVVCFIVFSFVGYYGFANVVEWRNQTFFTLPFVPQAVFSLAVPVGSVLMVYYLLKPSAKDGNSSDSLG